MWIKPTLTILVASALVACGGGGSSNDNSTNPGNPEPTAQRGVFVDSPVEGLSFRTAPGGLEGTTDADGAYQFEPGDTVTFFIGDLEFAEVEARGLVNPLHMAGTDDLSDQVVVNIARLLQSLDDDGDASNGIRIPGTASNAATQIDFDQPSGDFETDNAVTQLVANSGSDTVALLPEGQTSAHLAASLERQKEVLLGSWVFTDNSGSPDKQTHIVLSFLADQTVVIANDEPDHDPVGEDGFEVGQYQWNTRTGVLDVTLDQDTNGEWGLSHPCDNGNFVLDPRGDQLFVTTDTSADPASNCESEDTVFHRQPSNSGEIPGSWRIDADGEPVVLLTLMANGGYMLVEIEDNPSGEDDNYGWPGIERGTYSVAANGQARFNTITNTDGDRGLSHSCAVILDIPDELSLDDYNRVDCGPDGRDIVETLTVDGDTLTFISEADTLVEGTEQPALFQRTAIFKDSQQTTGGEDLDLTGTWIFDIEEDATDCGASAPENYTETFAITQSGNDLSVQDGSGNDFEGTLGGQELEWSGSFPEDGGTTSVTLQATVGGDGDTISGDSTFNFSDGQDQCSGTTTFTGTRN